MRILIAIPHVFNPTNKGRYGSTRPNPQPRIAALTQLLRNLYTLFAGAQESWYRSGDQLQVQPANQWTNIELDVVVCTTGELHVVDQLTLPPNLFVHHSVDDDPMFVGFACHEVLRERLGDYDLFGYMEDDLILHDPAFFIKLLYVQQLVGNNVLLQPNRYERYGTLAAFKKVYIDFEFAPPTPSAEAAESILPVEFLGQQVVLHPTTNGHAGCFFLNATQMDHWAAQDYFGDRNTSYVGPLESAATLGIMRTFQLYKPAPHNASFLEIEHYGQQWSHQMAAVRFAPSSNVTQSSTSSKGPS